MATILNAYNLTGGDTTSLTFTSSVDCVSILAVTTSFSGVNSLLKIQSSDDQSTWKDIGQILLSVGSDIYCSDPVKVTGIYVRCLLVTNDSTSGTITVSATNGAAGTGYLLSTNNLSDVADAETANNNLGQNDESYTPTITVWGGAATTVVVDGLAQAILINDNSVTVMVKFNVSFDAAEDIVESSFTLPPSFLPTNNFSAKSNVLASVAIYNEGAFDGTSFGFAVFALAGSKECYLSINTDTAGSSGSLVVIFRYNKNN